MLTFNCTLSPQISHLSTAVHRPSLKTTIRNGPEPPVWLAAMYLRSSLHLVGESSYTLFALTEPPLINLFSPSVVGSSSYLINLLPLQLTNRSGYVSYFGFFFRIFSFRILSRKETSSIGFSIARWIIWSFGNRVGPCFDSISHHWQHALVENLHLQTFLDGKIWRRRRFVDWPLCRS